MNAIERYGHGGDIWTAGETFGTPPETLLDFSANINPFGPPDGLFSFLADALSAVTRYPDAACRSFRRKLAESLGVKESELFIGNGGAECIQLAVDSLGVRRVGLAYPCFSEYEAAARKAGCDVVPVFTGREACFLPTLDELSMILPAIDMLFLGYPNNPTGNLLPVEELRELAGRCEEHQTYLCVDEAFLDFVPDGETLSLLSERQRFPHLLLIRSMTKMFAIPGLRLGYVVGNEQSVARLQSRQIPWSVNSLAQAAGEWLLGQDAFVHATRLRIRQERETLVRGLAELPGVQVFPGVANYLLLYMEGISSFQLQREMARRGVLVRNCSMYPGLADGYIRVAVKTAADNQQMLRVLREALAACRSGEGER